MLNMGDCVVRDDRGLVLAKLRERGEIIQVEQMPTCSIGMYFYILAYLKELGFDVE